MLRNGRERSQHVQWKVSLIAEANKCESGMETSDLCGSSPKDHETTICKIVTCRWLYAKPCLLTSTFYCRLPVGGKMIKDVDIDR